MRYIIVILLCFFSFTGFSQEYKCGYYGKKTVAERNSMFPFNEAKKIVLVSYKNCEPMSKLVDSLTLNEARIIDSKIITKYGLIIKDT